MKASIIDLRYRMKEVLRALRRRESVHVLYHGKEAGIIIPAKKSSTLKVSEHPFFGSAFGKSDAATLEKIMNQLRKSR